MAAITKSAHERLQKKHDKLAAQVGSLETALRTANASAQQYAHEADVIEREIERFHELLDELPDAPPREVREDGETRVLSITARFILSKH